MKIVCKRLEYKDRWEVVDPTGRSRGMLIYLSERINICQLIKSYFSIEIEVEGEGFAGKVWMVLIYASTDDHIRQDQWEILKARRRFWGAKWILRGDFNDIISHEDKIWGEKKG